MQIVLVQREWKDTAALASHATKRGQNKTKK